ncbi:hypothetical protein OV320_4094 [Actinobacteria bacterium OV320]|nr:hypothetical protein OV320_4094 [Actinobacteria bacterium OV320]
MGLAPSAVTVAARDAMTRLRDMYEPILALLGLSVDSIKNYDLPDLEQALTRVNEAISHPEQFGTMPTSNVKMWVVENPERKIGILPFLLERKRLILERIKELRSKERLDGLQDLIERLPPGPEKDELKRQLEALEAEAATAREQERAAAQVDSAAQALVVEGWEKEHKAKEEAEDELKKLREEKLLEEEIADRKWNRRVAREPIATLVGAILLIALTAVFVVSMFLKIVPSTLLSNSFLIILGYFFGQSASSVNRPQSTESARSSGKKKRKVKPVKSEAA